MATAADKKRWDDLHASYAVAKSAATEFENQLRARYGWNDRHFRQWAKSTEREKLEKLEAKTKKIGDKIFDLLDKVSPRDWHHGVPFWWVVNDLTWEDAIRPKEEPLSVVPPTAYGYDRPIQEEQSMRRRTMREVDFNDEESVLAEMAGELDIPADELTITEDDGLTGFRTGTVYEISLGRKEWRVVESEDQERELALEIVKQDLDDQPEIFNQSFIESHINMDRLRRDLRSDVVDSEMDRLQDMADTDPEDFWREYGRFSPDGSPDEDDDGELPEPSQSAIEELADLIADSQLEDPMQYLEDIYSREEAVKKAIEIAGIDIDAAAEEAVSADGPAHFLSSYDGNTTVTKSGLVYWRVN